MRIFALSFRGYCDADGEKKEGRKRKEGKTRKIGKKESDTDEEGGDVETLKFTVEL